VSPDWESPVTSHDKYTALTPQLYRYVVEHNSFRDPVSLDVEEAAVEMGGLADMQIGGDQAAFMTILTRAIGARRALEVGTFLGYGAIAVARGLPDDGKLICCEIDKGYAERARAHLEAAGVGSRVEIRVGSALDTLREIPTNEPFDLCFIDADKRNHHAYYEEALRLMRSGGLILLDNALYYGRVLNPDRDQSAAAVAALNDQLLEDDRVDVAMIGIADGISLVRKR
jgi:predicted O-methyltransferase YrrM